MTRPFRSAALLLLALWLVLMPWPARAHAQESGAPRPADAGDRDPHLDRKRRAYALMEEGKARFDLGKFDEAIDLFQKAYEVYPYPEALYSIAQAHRMKKDYERAVFFYKSYLRNEPNAPNRTTVEARIQEMERLDAEQKASAKKPPQGIQQPPSPDGGAPPAPAPAAESPAPAGAPLLVSPALNPATHDDTHAPWYHDGWGWALVGGGALVAGGGALLLPGAYSIGLEPGDQLRPEEERTDKRNRIIGWSLVGVGSAALVTGVVKLVLTDAPTESTRARAGSYDLVIGPRWLGVAGTF